MAQGWDVKNLLTSQDGPKSTGSEAKRRRAELRSLFDSFRPGPNTPYLIAFTATPGRADGIGLEAVLDDIVYEKNIRDLISAGWLVGPLGLKVMTGEDISGVKQRAGDFAEDELADAVNTSRRNFLAVDAYLSYASGRDAIKYPKRQALVYCVNVQHTMDMLSAFRSRNIQADAVIGTTPKEDRQRIVRQFRDGALDVLVNCLVLTEGADFPKASCIILARPTKSSTLYQQILGRGLRISPETGKKDCLVIDLEDNFGRTGIQNLSTMFGLPPKLKMPEPSNIMALRKEMDELESEGQLSAKAILEAASLSELRLIAEQVDPLAIAELEPEVNSAARLAWIRTPYGYAMGATRPGEGNGDIPPEEMKSFQFGVVINALGQGVLKLKLPMRPSQVMGVFPTAADAVKAAEEWVGAERPGALGLLNRKASWRMSKKPASDRQMDLLRRLGVAFAPGITKGQASILIDYALTKRRGAGIS